MGIEGGIVGGSAGGTPVSMELLQLISADPAEFQRRMGLIEQSKKDFDDQLEKNQIVGDILALRKEASDAVDKANFALDSAKKAAATLLADAKDKAERVLVDANTKATDILNSATEIAKEENARAGATLKQAQEKARLVEVREDDAATMMKDAEAKYAAIEPDRKSFQDGLHKAAVAVEEANQMKTEYAAKCAALDAVAKQIAKALSGAA